MRIRMKIGSYAALALFFCAGIAQAQIHVDAARIGCLDIQKDPNLTGLAGNACNGKMSCAYEAPTEQEYKRAGVVAKTRNFCSQAMEITYHCGSSGQSKFVNVPGDAWTKPPAQLACDPPPPPAGSVHDPIAVTTARIGCLDIQKDGNLTALVAAACNGRASCFYKAPTEEQYKQAGVVAKTRNMCSQGMEISYRCGQGAEQVVDVAGDAWNHPPAELDCQHPTVAKNRETVTPPENESCSLGSQVTDQAIMRDGYFPAPQALVDAHAPNGAYNQPKGQNIGANEGRLRPDLRAAAALQDPMRTLAWATVTLAGGNRELGLAYADLSVTGHNSFDKFRRIPPNENTVLAWLQNLASNRAPVPLAVAQNNAELLKLYQHAGQPALHGAATEALDRAYKVANVVRIGSSPDRPGLGYIAVSGEDDEPYWPVNVPSAPFPQYELMVPVGNKIVRTRYMIAETNSPAPGHVSAGHQLPADSRPVLSPNAEVLLYVHGMDSRLEEAVDMANALHDIARSRGKNFVIISMDLPTSGYADKINHFEISPITAIGSEKSFPPKDFDAHGMHNTPLLDFIENFIVSFVDTLDRQVPVKSKLQAIIGGSLGGNMSLRLGRRANVPWLKAVVPWSPGSIWDSLADGADLTKHIAVTTGWERAGGAADQVPEQPNSRRDFFQQAFDASINIAVVNIVPSQPYMWYRKEWPCLPVAVVVDRLERQEIYNSNFRLWHWRLGTEQLIYSHQAKASNGQPLYMENNKPMLLGCGIEDQFNYSDICPATQTVASRMSVTPGRALFLEHTGHSIHNERPRYWAAQIVQFLNM